MSLIIRRPALDDLIVNQQGGDRLRRTLWRPHLIALAAGAISGAGMGAGMGMGMGMYTLIGAAAKARGTGRAATVRDGRRGVRVRSARLRGACGDAGE